MPQPLPSTSTKPVVKFTSLFETPVDTKYIDMARVSKWLAHYLHTESPDEERLVAALVLGYMSRHRVPDPKVIQVQLTQSDLVSSDKVQRFMRKFWSMLLDDQATGLERRSKVSSKASRLPSPTESAHQRVEGTSARRTEKGASPTEKRTSPADDRDRGPKRICIDRHAQRDSDRRVRTSDLTHSNQVSERAPHMSSGEYYSLVAQSRPHHAPAPAGYSKSFFV